MTAIFGAIERKVFYFNRQHTFKIAAILLVLLVCTSQSGCTSLVIGAGATAGVAAMQERGLAGAAKDTAITGEIWQKFLSQDEKLFRDIEIEVVEGKVLLAGHVDTINNELEAVRLTWQVDGVKEVMNEIKVAQPVSMIDSANDLLITTRLKAALMFDANIYAINYSVETVNGTVYLMGIAQNAHERDLAVAHAKATSYVKRVVNFVRVKTPAPILTAGASDHPQ